MLIPWQSSQEWVEIPQADKGVDHWRQKQQGSRRDNTNPQGRTECRAKLTFAKQAAAGQPAKPLPRVSWIVTTICDLSTNIAPISQT